MNRTFIYCVLVITLLTAGLAAPLREASAQGAPVIAPEIGRVIAEEGVDAANQRFAELIETPSLDYSLEIQGLMTLMGSYMQSGNEAAGSAVGEMYSQVMQKMMTGPGGAYPPGMMEQMQKAEEAAKAQEAADREADRAMEQQTRQRARGKSRDDLQRFVGMYSDPDSDSTSRIIFVTVSCDGYLVTGPMWADVGPWWMRSAADKVFTYSDSFTNLSFEFVGDGDSRMKLNHDIESVTSPLVNKAPLPDDWDDCLPRPVR